MHFGRFNILCKTELKDIKYLFPYFIDNIMSYFGDHIFSFPVSSYSCSWWFFGSGRKWNPLHQRLDSYDYTVKQHVGSLLFTPFLLVLPTSIFYSFFSIVNTTINLICILIEVTISGIHATPYIKIFLWLAMRTGFPSGIWFEIVSCCSNLIDDPVICSPDKFDSPSENLHCNQNGEN